MMSSTTAQHTIEALWSIFSHFELSEQLVSDNGPQFISLCSPYHPSSNYLAEQYVPTCKWAMRAGEKDGTSLNHHLSELG